MRTSYKEIAKEGAALLREGRLMGTSYTPSLEPFEARASKAPTITEGTWWGGSQATSAPMVRLLFRIKMIKTNPRGRPSLEIHARHGCAGGQAPEAGKAGV